MSAELKAALDGFSTNERMGLISKKYRKKAEKIYELIVKETKKERPARETDLIHVARLKTRRHIFHGAVGALVALHLIEETGTAGNVTLFRAVTSRR